MRKILFISYYDVLRKFRDIKMLILIVVSPIVLIFILGNSLNSFLTLEYMPTPKVGYVNEDSISLSKSFDNFIESDEIKSIVGVAMFENRSEADVALENGEVGCIIYIGKEFTEKLNTHQDVSIEIYGTEDLSFVEALVKNYVNSFNMGSAILINGVTQSTEQISFTLTRGKINSDSIFPNSMDYYSIQTLLQILLLCGVFGISIILRDFSDGMHFRISSMPIRRSELIAGRIIGSILFSFIAAITTILFSKFVYKANWNGNIVVISLAILMFVMIAVGIGVLLAHITKNYMSSFGILTVFSLLFPTAAGAFSPKVTLPFIASISPNNYARDIIFGSIFEYPKNVIIQGFISLTIMIIIIYGLIILFERRRKYENF